MNRREMFKTFLAGLIPGAAVKETVKDASGDRATMVLEVPESYDLSPEDSPRIQKEWAVAWKGAKNVPRLIIVPPGCKLREIGK